MLYIMKSKQCVHSQSIRSMHFYIVSDILLDQMLHSVTSCILVIQTNIIYNYVKFQYVRAMQFWGNSTDFYTFFESKDWVTKCRKFVVISIKWDDVIFWSMRNWNYFCVEKTGLYLLA